MTYTVRDTCRLCDAKLPDERVLDLGETPLANALIPEIRYNELCRMGHMGALGPLGETYPLYLKQCATCGHVQLPVVVDPKLLFPADYPYASSTGASMREHLAKMAVELTAGECVGGVVEIGSNDGYLLEQLNNHGWLPIGIDPALSLAMAATQRGLLTIPCFFTPSVARAIFNASGYQRLIVANNVFAHADDLNAIVEGVKTLLHREGRFVFEVGYLPDVLRTNNFGTVYHEHQSYHSARPLAAFFERHGLELYDVQHVDTQGGSIRCFVGEPGFHKGKRDHMLSVIEAEEKWCIPEALAGWQSRVNKAARELNWKLTALKELGKSIAAYGCSAKSTTLLHVAGIGRETIDFICDSNPNKIGKFSPGRHIEIVHPDELERRQPDYCVSLSGNFTAAFRAQHPNYRGEWIEPQFT